MNIGIIGAGSISEYHIEALKLNNDCRVCAISDLNIDLAKSKAEKYNIEKVFSDYNEMLKDESIDAVSIVTPTFTHKRIITDALNAGKHILCEKPPALNADEVKECADLAKKVGKVLMFAFVCRFRSQMQYMKKLADEGKLGRPISGEAVRMHRCDHTNGWFLNKSKAGGGPLIDAVIHELDAVLYLMGYPQPKSVHGFTSDVNKDLPQKVQGEKNGWMSADNTSYERDVENVASGFITFENGAYVFVKTSTILNVVEESTYIELECEKTGVRMEPFTKGKELRLIRCTDDYFLKEENPALEDADIFYEEMKHFIDCCNNKTECICKNEEAVMLMKIIDAIYKSAETGETIYF